MKNGIDVLAFAGITSLAAAVICVTVWLLDRWLLRQDKPRVRRPLRVLKIKKHRYEPPAPKRLTVYPDGTTK